MQKYFLIINHGHPLSPDCLNDPNTGWELQAPFYWLRWRKLNWVQPDSSDPSPLLLLERPVPSPPHPNLFPFSAQCPWSQWHGHWVSPAGSGLGSQAQLCAQRPWQGWTRQDTGRGSCLFRSKSASKKSLLIFNSGILLFYYRNFIQTNGLNYIRNLRSANIKTQTCTYLTLLSKVECELVMGTNGACPHECRLEGWPLAYRP